MLQLNKLFLITQMSLLYYAEDSLSTETDIAKYITRKAASLIDRRPASVLPPPRKKDRALPPPKPIDIHSASIENELSRPENENVEYLEISLNELRDAGMRLAKNNAVVKDDELMKGVGVDRAKSQLTYLERLDYNTRGSYRPTVRRAYRY